MKTMKNLLAAALMMSFVGLYSQTSVGIKIGYSNSNMNINLPMESLSSNTDAFSGFTAGVTSEIGLGHGLSLAPELHYTQRGSIWKPGFNVDLGPIDIPVGLTITNKINYLDLPVLMRYKLDAGPMSLYFDGGLAMNYALNASVSEEVNIIINQHIATQNLNLGSNSYNRIGVAGVIGAGIEYPLSTTGLSLSLDARYNHAFNNFLDVSEMVDTKAKGMEIGIGIKKSF